MLFAQFGSGQVLWSLLWFFLFFIWIMILFQVIADIFRSDDMGGGGKALWLALVIFLPYLGIFLYLITRGHGMGARQMRMAEEQQQAFQDYVRDAAGGSADQITKLAALHDAGKLSDEEFANAKGRILA